MILLFFFFDLFGYKYLAGCGADIHVIVKIESADSIPNLNSIITASDGVIFRINLVCSSSFNNNRLEIVI